MEVYFAIGAVLTLSSFCIGMLAISASPQMMKLEKDKDQYWGPPSERRARKNQFQKELNEMIRNRQVS